MSERLEDIKSRRIEKIHRLESMGISPYPSTTGRTHTNAQALQHYMELQGQKVSLVGRIRSMRGMGKILFAHIEDGTARIQVLLKQEEVGDAQFSFFLDTLDTGDFIEATGILFETKTAEKTLQVSSFKLLAKSVLPLPSDHFGIADEEDVNVADEGGRLRNAHDVDTARAKVRHVVRLAARNGQVGRHRRIRNRECVHGTITSELHVL